MARNFLPAQFYIFSFHRFLEEIAKMLRYNTADSVENPSYEIDEIDIKWLKNKPERRPMKNKKPSCR